MDIRGVTALFLCSETLSQYDVLGPSGNKSIIKRIPIVEPAGSVVWDTHTGLLTDCVHCGGQSFRQLQFSVRDAYNNLVDIKGSVSFSIVFAREFR